MSPVVLEIRDLTASYGSVPILRGASLTAGQREVVGLVGRNGVGKSTLVKALMGLLPASAGTIALHGVDLTGTASYLRARQGLGYVPQGRGSSARSASRRTCAWGRQPWPASRRTPSTACTSSSRSCAPYLAL